MARIGSGAVSLRRLRLSASFPVSFIVTSEARTSKSSRRWHEVNDAVGRDYESLRGLGALKRRVGGTLGA